MLKKSILVTFITIVVLTANFSHAANYEGQVIKKEASILGTDFPDKTMNELKEILLEKAKQMAFSEIYREMVHPKAEVVLAHDLISSEVLEIIRIKGTPTFYNGKIFGELCVSIEAFVAQEDLIKFKPENVIIKKFCLNISQFLSNKPDIAFAELISKAHDAAYIEIIKRHNPSLQNISINKARSIIHDFYTSNENLAVNTGEYCMDVSANIIPIEIEIVRGKNKHTSSKPTSISKTPIAKKETTVQAKEKTTAQKDKKIKISRVVFYDMLLYKNKKLFRANNIYSAVASPDGKRVIMITGSGLGIVSTDESNKMHYQGIKLSDLAWTGNNSFLLQIGHTSLGDYNGLKEGIYEATINESNSITSLTPHN